MTHEALARILDAGSAPGTALALVAGALLGGWLTRRDSLGWPLPRAQRIAVLVVVVFGGLAGCAIPAFLAGDLIHDLALQHWRGPKTIMGGLLGAFFAAAVYKRSTGIAYDTSDAFARGTCLMMAVGRLGCIGRHCCFGIEAPVGTAWLAWDLGDGVPRVPVQALEAVLVFGLFLWLDRCHRRGEWKNRRLFMLFFAYGLIRFVLEFLREQFAGGLVGLGFYQWIALALAGVGAYQVRKRTPVAPTLECGAAVAEGAAR